MAKRHMRSECWITKATDTHSECVIIIVFPHQQWLDERASMLSYPLKDELNPICHLQALLGAQ